VSRKLQIDPVACAVAAAETAMNLKPCVLGSKIQGVMTALERPEAAATPSAASNRVVNGEESLYKRVGQWMAKAAASVAQSWRGWIIHDARSERLGCWVKRLRVLLQTYTAWLERMSLGRLLMLRHASKHALKQDRKHYIMSRVYRT
jgi:hypothetical protein